MLKSVMIIDDSDVDRMLLKRKLKKSGIVGDVFERENGVTGIDFLKELKDQGESHLPDLVFLDINMPLMDGFKFLEEFEKLRQQEVSFQKIVFSMFSSSNNERDIEKAMKYEFLIDYICKGDVTKMDLEEWVRNHFPDLESA